ncbi:uncharacterized protein PHACADRAFT_184788 [Phanerochaete carnosa HHB-10118-sp]|uniref:F-box domain-containing protein n=1 Tax=Phanerochaete carnosa (strain HHB-10118-sp) TaxID=650164 RepID=K5WA32_PHACS|nr:uncharacterized protein PHACADRAFT_184788 [Phanerochaete carnosa HHB-10118-sp]EKM56080.1 hypothetical protein PHACADRAFT_184788 [Phanerochaete carnosa HHB-10118-sp]
MPLNWDVLAEVMIWLDRPDTTRMSRTCRALRVIAPRMLLKDVVLIWRAEQLSSLCRFMFADRRRFRFLRKLSLEFLVEAEDLELGRLTADLFSHLTELEWLDFYDCRLLELHKSVLPPISALAKLQTLKLENLTEHTYKFIKNTRLPLLEIVINFHGYYHFVDPIPVLSPFRHSLKKATVTFVDLSARGVRYPLVTTLHVGDCDAAELRVLESCFLNLRELSFESAHEEVMWSGGEVEMTRNLNLNPEIRDPWASLARLTGDILSLYILGVQCREWNTRT